MTPSSPAPSSSSSGFALLTVCVVPGYFDPLKLSENKAVREVKKWREAELKHGRVAMLATVGMLVQERW